MKHFFLTFFVFWMSNVFAASSCDELAALEADPLKTAPSVSFSDITAEAVILLCSRAIEKNDQHYSRYLLQRARGYLKKGDIDLALADLTASHDMQYAASTFGLATAYFLGDDIKQNLPLAEKLFLLAYEGGVIWSARGLSLLYGKTTLSTYNKQKSELWEARFQEHLNK